MTMTRTHRISESNIAEMLYAHLFDAQHEACTCGARFDRTGIAYRAWSIHAASSIDGVDEPVTVAEAIREHSFVETSVSGNPVCCCGAEALDGDLVRHIAGSVAAQIGTTD